MRRADELIHRFIDSIGQPEGSSYVGLFSSWQEIVGERIAAHAQPIDVRGQSLIIVADHPGWVQMVMMKRARIIGELSSRYPELRITGLSVRLADPNARTRHGRPAEAEPAREPVPEPVKASNPPSRSSDEALERIDDEQLREVLRHLREDLESNDHSASG